MIASRRTGDPNGPVILALNGGMMSLGAWRPVFECGGVFEGFGMLGCDFRGQLLSPGPPRLSLDEHVDDVIGVLDRHEIEKVHVLGASFGGFAGLLLAARAPERVRSVVAVTVVDRVEARMKASAIEGSQRVAGVLAGADAGAYWDDLTDAVYSSAYRAANAEVLAQRRAQVLTLPRSWWEGLAGIIAILDRIDLRDALPSIRCPVQVQLAAADAVMDLEHGRAVATAIRGAECLVHPTAGHGLILEDIEWVATNAAAFFRRRDAEEGR